MGMKNIKNKGLILIRILLIGIFIYCALMAFSWYFNGRGIRLEKVRIEKLIDVREIQDDENTVLVGEKSTADSLYWKYVKLPLIDVDFKYLLEVNPDTVGYINVIGTNINYPFVQALDNNFYLTHSFEKKKNKAGWIFADYRNSMTDLNKNTVLYGHARLDGVLFGTLRNTLKWNWLEKSDNHIIRLSTPRENTMWQIFAVYKHPSESYYIQTSFSSDSDYELWLKEMKSRSLYDFKTTVEQADKVLTLSTCYDSLGNRIVLHAKLIKMKTKIN